MRQRNKILFMKCILATFMAFEVISCKSERLEPDAHSTSEVVYNTPVTLSFGASLEGEARALDFVVYDEEKNGETNANPHLELEQFQNPEGMEVNLIFVRTDSQGAGTPVSVVQTRLKPESAYHNPSSSVSPIPERSPRLERYLRTDPGTGNTVTLAAGTDLSQGTWKVAIFVGDLSNRRNSSIKVDPNHLERVQPLSPVHLQSDHGIEDQYEAGHSNLTPISKTSLGQTNLSSEEKAQLAVPYISEWVTITPSMFVEKGRTPKLDLGRIPLRPQGTLLRIQVRNQDFSSIKLAGMRLLTNSLSFRGAYAFGDANLRANAQSTNGDLSLLYEDRNIFGWAYQDSIERTIAFPNYADFWVDKSKAEELVAGEDSKYYLIWAMPRRDPDNNMQSRRGILHVLLYDANRTESEYNRTLPQRGARMHGIIPRALIRKPALTRTFGAGFFRLSNASQGGQFFRLHAVQTKIYNFLDFMVPVTDRNYYSLSEMRSYAPAVGSRVASKADWAGVFPVKLPDNPLTYNGQRLDHYFVVGASAFTNRFFNSNRYGQTGFEYIGSGPGDVQLVISNQDSGYFTPQAGEGYDISLAGKSNNVQMVHVPKEMQVPVIRGNVLQEPEAREIELNFSTYQSQANRFVLIGWGEGQTYLSLVAYRRNGNTIEVTSRYLGPALHRPYVGQWQQSFPWGVSFYPLGISEDDDPRSTATSEIEDTKRDVPALGYLLDNNTQPETDLSPFRSANSMMYWSSDSNWMYLYFEAWNNSASGYSERTNPASGFGVPANADRSVMYGADWSRNPKAPIMLFSTKPQPRQ